MAAVKEHAPQAGIAPVCRALAVPRASLYRSWAREKTPATPVPPRPTPPRALDSEERQQVLDMLRSERFVDKPPPQVYAALLDEGVYVCSVRTMYRVLASEGEVRERRDQAQHPVYPKPELVATRPNELWSWDITKLLGPVKWTYFYLYVILDVFSRYAVGWMLARQETAVLAHRLIAETCRKQGIVPAQLTLHADRGCSMKSKPVALLLSDLGVTKTHSRPRVSNDNPFSESQFKTLKYRPQFPNRFGSIEDARKFCVDFFDWYNRQHYHSGIAFLTPQTVHYGLAPEVTQKRQRVLDLAHVRHPDRFVRKPPTAPLLPEAVWINRPENHRLDRLPDASQNAFNPEAIAASAEQEFSSNC